MATKLSKSDTSSSGSRPSKMGVARTYFEESRAELKKVTWPGKKEVKVTTIAVLILVVVMSIFLGLADVFLSWVIELITSMGR